MVSDLCQDVIEQPRLCLQGLLPFTATLNLPAFNIKVAARHGTSFSLNSSTPPFLSIGREFHVDMGVTRGRLLVPNRPFVCKIF
jgi:hypothetical protein